MAAGGGLYPDCTIKTVPPNTDLSSRCIPIHAHDLKNGQWCLDDKTGIPGVVSDLKMSKTGKHGHAKFTYKLRMPHSGRSSSMMHPGGDHLIRPVMEKKEFSICYFNEDDSEVVCLNDANEEVFFKLSPDRAEVFEQVTSSITKSEETGAECVLTVLEGPRKKGGNIDILQIVQTAKLVGGPN